MGAIRSRPANLASPISPNSHNSSNYHNNQSNHYHSHSHNHTTGSNDASLVSKTVNVPRERGRHGVVHVKISSLTYANRRTPENETSMVVTPRGAIFYGSQTSPGPTQRALSNSGVPMLPPLEVPISDSRAHKLMVIHTDDWYVVPSQEPFSRHSGTCFIIGDKKGSTGPYHIKLGDCFRLGSVGVVVSEIKTEADAIEQRLDARKLQYLKDEALAFDSEEDMAALASDEEQRWRQSTTTAKPSDLNLNDQCEPLDRKNALFLSTDDHDLAPDDHNLNHPETPNSIATMKSHFSPEKPNSDVSHNYSRNNFAGPSDEVYGSGGIANGERFVCYMCYETHDTPSDPLVAPCDCKGDTRYLHVQCLQKWYHSSVAGPQARVIRTTGTGAPACKICGVAYKTTFKRSDGRRANLLEMECEGPYISLVVVTRHDTNPGLFNTKFRLNFGRLENSDLAQDIGFSNSLLIGRSSTCNMVLDYRTVSTVHAKICYEDGGFTIQDRDSSNGTMVYLQAPMPLKFSTTIRIRMGRTTMTFQPKRSWTAAIRSAIANNFPYLSSGESRNDHRASDVNNITNNRAASAAASSSSSSSSHQSGNRRSSSTGALPSRSENDVLSNRRRLSGGVDVIRGSSGGGFYSPRYLTADELQQIMAESNLIAAASANNNNSSNLNTQDTRGGTNPRSSPNHSLREEVEGEDIEPSSPMPQRSQSFSAVGSNEENVNIRRVLFHHDPESDPVQERPGESPSNRSPRRGSGIGPSTGSSRRRSISGPRPQYPTDSNGINVNGSESNYNSSNQTTPPLSPMRGGHETRKDPTIIFSSNDLSHDEDSLMVGTSFDLMLESSSSNIPNISTISSANISQNNSSIISVPVSPGTQAFDVDGAVAVPPAGVFSSHPSSSSRPSSRGLAISSASDQNYT